MDKRSSFKKDESEDIFKAMERDLVEESIHDYSDEVDVEKFDKYMEECNEELEKELDKYEGGQELIDEPEDTF